MEGNEWQAVKPALAAIALLVGIGLLTFTAYLMWMLVSTRWSWGGFVVSVNLFFLGTDLCVAGLTGKKPKTAELLTFLIPP